MEDAGLDVSDGENDNEIDINTDCGRVVLKLELPGVGEA